VGGGFHHPEHRGKPLISWAAGEVVSGSLTIWKGRSDQPEPCGEIVAFGKVPRHFGPMNLERVGRDGLISSAARNTSDICPSSTSWRQELDGFSPADWWD